MVKHRAFPVSGTGGGRSTGSRHEAGMNEFELQRLSEAQLTAQVADERIPAHDRSAAGAVLDACGRLLGARLPPADEHRTWVFSDPHFELEVSVAIFGRPFRHCRHADGYLLEQWTRDVLDHDTVICLGMSPWTVRRTA